MAFRLTVPWKNSGFGKAEAKIGNLFAPNFTFHKVDLYSMLFLFLVQEECSSSSSMWKVTSGRPWTMVSFNHWAGWGSQEAHGGSS